MTELGHPVKDATEDDAVLVRACQAGDRAAFDALVIRHKNRLFHLCYRLLGDYQEANDSAQEVFLKAYRSLKSFRAEAQFSTWLFRIAVNTCKNRLASLEFRQRKQTVRIENPGGSSNTQTPLEIHDTAPTPVHHLERKEKMLRIQEAINTLPPEPKAIVILRDIQGLSYEEIVGITGLNLGTVKSRLSRARLELREKLRELV